MLCTKAERSEPMSEADKNQLEIHCKEKKATYQRFRAHQKFKSLNNNTITTSFDLQKVLTTPNGNNMLLGYSRKYAEFNFTLYESGTQNGYCYIWVNAKGREGVKKLQLVYTSIFKKCTKEM